MHLVGPGLEVLPAQEVGSSAVTISDPGAALCFNHFTLLTLISPRHEFGPRLLAAHPEHITSEYFAIIILLIQKSLNRNYLEILQVPEHGDGDPGSGAAEAGVEDVGGHGVRVTPRHLGPGPGA